MQTFLDEQGIPDRAPTLSAILNGAISPSVAGPPPGDGRGAGDVHCANRGKPDSPPGPLSLPYLVPEYDGESAITESPFQNFDKCAAEARRRRRNPDTGGLHGGGLGGGITLAARNDGTSMAHPSARRSRATGDEAHHGLAAAPLG